MPKFLICITARMASKRLLNKALYPIYNSPAISYLIERLKMKFSPEQICLCTTQNREDDILGVYGKAHRVRVYYGSETDVLSRLYQASFLFGVENVVRITGDDCFTDTEILEDQLKYHVACKFDFTPAPAIPKGMEVEIVSSSLIRKCYEIAQGSNTEFMTDIFKKHALKIGDFKTKLDNSLQISLSLDTVEDYRRITGVVAKMKSIKPFFSVQDLIEAKENGVKF